MISNFISPDSRRYNIRVSRLFLLGILRRYILNTTTWGCHSQVTLNTEDREVNKFFVKALCSTYMIKMRRTEVQVQLSALKACKSIDLTADHRIYG